MSEFLSLLKVIFLCGTVFFIAMLVLLALPQSRLRSVGLECAKWLLTGGLLLLTISPLDVIPDVVPIIGWGDDIAYVIGAICTAKSALKERRERALMEN